LSFRFSKNCNQVSFSFSIVTGRSSLIFKLELSSSFNSFASVFSASVLDGIVGIFFRERLTFFFAGAGTSACLLKGAGGIFSTLGTSTGLFGLSVASLAIFFLMLAPIEQEKQVE
jgi:hypothetical protein